MTNILTYSRNFAAVRHAEDMAVELDYRLEPQHWPWLGLAPAHPVLIEKYQYFGATTASWALKLFKPESFTALTRFHWACHPAAWGKQYADRGRCVGRNDDNGMGFQLDISNAQGDVFYRTAGDGFVFTDRDFRLWREKTRQQTQQTATKQTLNYASPLACGLNGYGQSFVMQSDTPNHILALVGKETGFHPLHPFHTGSGDHVNAAQLLDCALQAIHLFTGEGRNWPKAMECHAGEAQFQRYVELDIPFEIQLSKDADDAYTLHFGQAGHANATMKLSMRKHEDLG